MAEITAALVKDLREKTGAGMMDCKKALTETGGDIEAAVDWLRKKGLAAAAKKAGRVAAEGLVGVAVARHGRRRGRGQRRDRFRRPQRDVPGLRRATSPRSRSTIGDDLEAIKAAPYPGHRPHRRRGTDAAGRHHRREHEAPPRRACCASRRAWSRPTCTTRWRPGLGKIGVLVALEVDRRHGGAGGARPPGRACTSPRPSRDALDIAVGRSRGAGRASATC